MPMQRYKQTGADRNRVEPDRGGGSEQEIDTAGVQGSPDQHASYEMNASMEKSSTR